MLDLTATNSKKSMHIIYKIFTFICFIYLFYSEIRNPNLGVHVIHK